MYCNILYCTLARAHLMQAPAFPEHLHRLAGATGCWGNGAAPPHGQHPASAGAPEASIDSGSFPAAGGQAPIPARFPPGTAASYWVTPKRSTGRA